MKKLFAPILVAGGILTLYFLGKRNLSKKITFNLVDIGTAGKFFSPIVVLKFAVNNPTNQSATINSIVGELILNGKKVADVTNFAKQNISANSQSVIKVDFQPSILSVVRNLVQAIAKKNKTNKFIFTGNANVENVVVPIDQSIIL